MNDNKFKKYLAVQKSGVTNMFDVKVVSSLTGLTREEILDIMKNYSEYLEAHNRVQNLIKELNL